MSKQEFLEILDKKLKSLSKGEINDILSEYSQHIDSKVADGKTVDEAIEDFGDIDSLVAEILMAYNVDPDFKIKSVKNKLSYFIESFGDFINKMIDKIMSLSRKELGSIIIRILVLVLCLLIIKIPFEFFSSSIYSMFSFLPHFIVTFVNGIFNLIFDLIYLAIGAYVVYVFIKRNLLKVNKEVCSSETEEVIMNNDVNNNTSSNFEKKNKTKIEYSYNEIEQMSNTNSNYKVTVGDVLYSTVTVIVKIFLIILFIPIFFSSLALVISFGILVALAIMGYPLMGVSMILLGISVAFIGVCTAMYNFIFKGGKKNEKVSN